MCTSSLIDDIKQIENNFFDSKICDPLSFRRSSDETDRLIFSKPESKVVFDMLMRDGELIRIGPKKTISEVVSAIRHNKVITGLGVAKMENVVLLDVYCASRMAIF